jgi:hypothetical protein
VPDIATVKEFFASYCSSSVIFRHFSNFVIRPYSKHLMKMEEERFGGKVFRAFTKNELRRTLKYASLENLLKLNQGKRDNISSGAFTKTNKEKFVIRQDRVQSIF